MKRRIVSIFSIILLTALLFCSCKDSGGVFTHAELTLVLDGSFEEKESEDFDLLLSNGTVAVSVTRLSFVAAFNQGISDTYTAKGFGAFFMHQSGKSDEIFVEGDVPYYTYTEKTEKNELFYTVTFYRSKNAYFIVSYVTPAENGEEYLQAFLNFAKAAYFNDSTGV